MPSNQVKFRLKEADPDFKEDIVTVVRLHRELLDWGPISKLGGYFMQRFIYSHLIRDGLISAALFEVDGDAAGFVAYTPCSYTFHRQAIKDHWMRVGYFMVISIFRNPRILFRLLKAVHEMFARRSETISGDEAVGEILAIGVKQEYQNPEFIYRTHLRISDKLFNHVVDKLKGQGIKRLRLMVDIFNKPALLFYHGMGGRIESNRISEEAKIHIWFDI